MLPVLKTPQTNLSLILLSEQRDKAIGRVCNSLNVSARDVSEIEKGLLAPLKSLNPDDFFEPLRAIIMSVATAYCGAKVDKTNDLVWNESLRLIKGSFTDLGLDEFIEAFRLAASGKFDVDLAAYGGSFSVNILGLVLNKYKAYRSKVAIALREVADELIEEQREIERKEKDKAAAIRWVEEFRVAISLKDSAPVYKSWDSTLSAFCEAVIRSGQFEFPDEAKREAWDKAKRLAVYEIKAKQVSNNYSSYGERCVIKSLLKELEEKREIPGELRARCRSYYPKILVWDLYLRPASESPVIVPNIGDSPEKKSEENL